MSFSASLAWASIASIAPWPSKGQSAKAMLAAFQISVQAALRIAGRPRPPYSGAAASEFQPPAIHCA